ncbi:SPT3 Dosage dependent suppressor of Ty-induced promoter mutations-like protein [Mortierella alpina]|uniref:SPT3 Dosage dependent suppressor of Ty-induced promoter mutations-like protein n=1 Tax=Mortierella alpina TaxID=64518 RepID=A0A9P6IS65_MORAP|nr:SPT3 Dosage dependent suppressor of Ty-induced promoter mutations-like protein [Mortierella alpina]
MSIDSTVPGGTALSGFSGANHDLNSYSTNGWAKPDNAVVNRNMAMLGPGSPDLRRLSYSSGASDMSVQMTGFAQEMGGYNLNARIIRKKDQLDELSPSGAIVAAPVVDEVRTGQQFLIKLQLTKQGGVPPPAFPTMRVERREAINTAGEPRADAEPLTLQIIVHLAKSGQIRKGACAKCCHKVRVYSLKRLEVSLRLKNSSDDDGETIAVCSTAPIICSGHHKAKRVYPSQRPSKVTKDGPVPKTKTIKHHKSVPDATGSHQVPALGNSDSKEDFFRSGSFSGSSSYPSPMSFMHDNITNSSLLSNFGDDQLSDFDLGGSMNTSDYNNSSNITQQQQQQQPLLSSSESPSGAGHPSTQAPRVFEVRPDRGPIRKTTDVVLRGLFFCDGMVPYFGCFPAQDIVVETSNLIICKAPESPLPGTVPITIYDSMGASFADLGQFTYTDDSETELLILQIQLRLAHRALEYLHTQATGQRGNANEILREIPGLAQSPRSGGGSPGESEPAMLTLEQVEDGLLKTLNNLPTGMDISIQLEDQSNLLHLSILLGFDRLTMRLIEEGCELDTLDAYAMTPLMYAVVKGNEQVARALVVAGAASSGAKTPREFYAMLPRPIVPTPAMVSYLSVSCTRHSTTSRVLVASTDRRGPVMIEIENDEGSISSDSELDSEDKESEVAEKMSQDTLTPSNVQNMPAITRISLSEDATSLDQLAHTIRGMHVNANMAPLAQQGLPPMHVVDADGSVTVNNQVLKADEILRGDLHGAETIATANDESGYHSGIVSEVQDRLSYMSHSALPKEGVTMSVHFNRAASSVKPSSPSTPTPDNLFRTGDSFGIEIRLATLPGSNMSLPTEFLGVRFPHEMVKRVNGRPASILKEMAYDLKMSIELGKSNMETVEASSSGAAPTDDHQGDGIELKSACQACARFLHEHKKISPSRMSPEDASAYPILQFSVPTSSTALVAQGSASPLEIDRGTGIMEVRHGHVEVKARVNCSSLHHLIQREKAKRTAALRLQQQQQGATSSSSTPATRTQLDMKDLEDPGFVFSFELVHPHFQTVVARFQTGPFLFQSYSRGRS